MKMNTGRDDFEIEFEGDDLTMTLPEEMAYCLLYTSDAADE